MKTAGSIAGLLCCLLALGYALSEDAGVAQQRSRNKPDPFIQELVNNLWNSDENRVKVVLNFQDRLSRGPPYSDNAHNPLISSLPISALSKPTHAAFIKLLDNYYRDTSKKEEDTQEEKNELNNFVNLLLDSKVMEHLFKALVSKKVITNNKNELKNLLMRLWFNHYSRVSNIPGSSGFEHVFVGEINSKKKEPMGLHNWIQYYLLEKNREVDYHGYFSSRRLGQTDASLINFRFTIRGDNGNNLVKPTTSMFVGTSPEFEIALYTACLLLPEKGESCIMNVGNTRIKIMAHKYNIPGNSFSVGTVYPILQ